MRRVALVLGGLVVLIVVLRVHVSGREDLDVAAGARVAGLRETAADFYGRAARWYLPFSSVQQEALDALVDMAREASGDRAFALRCLWEARGAILGTRWLFTPARKTLEEINREIARHMAAQDAVERGERGLSEAAYLELLERDVSPNPFLSLVSFALFVCFVGVLVRGGLVAVSTDGVVRWRVLGAHVAVACVFLVGWLVALAFA